MNYTLLGGMSIGFGAMFFLAVGEPYAFTLGIIAIISLEIPLITGYIPLSIYRQEIKLSTTIKVLFGNIIGAGLTGTWLYSVPKRDILLEKSEKILTNKISMTNLELVNSGMITGMLIALGVIAYNIQKKNLLGIMMLLMSVMAFVALGTDHIVANAFYIVTNKSITIQEGFRVLAMSGVGNIVGGSCTGLAIVLGGK